MADVCPVVQTLDAPVPQMVDSVLEFFRRLDLPVAEQVIDVPMFSSPSSCPSRAALSEPQLVEQLVEVPTVLSYSLLQQRTAEQIVDTPALHGRGGGARGGLQGLSQGQDSTAVCGAENLVIQLLTVVEEVLVEVFKASPRDRAQQRFVEQNMLTLLLMVISGL